MRVTGERDIAQISLHFDDKTTPFRISKCKMFSRQIYLGDEAFVAEMQKKIGTEQDDLNIPKQQKRPLAKPLSEIAAQVKDRKTAIIAAHKTGAYSQRENGEYHTLHPTTVGVILRKNKNP
ncbi:MAG: hypothetical protein NPIRA03_01170 [Nitrospirales bacterium]|nr:MAG: hypothetical protein NPIRA03_01170 [Nitrospirales bacterium]